MTEDELRTVLKDNGGWSVSKKPVRHGHYLYAVRRNHGEREEIYLCALSKLVEKSEGDIVARLSSASK